MLFSVLFHMQAPHKPGACGKQLENCGRQKKFNINWLCSGGIYYCKASILTACHSPEIMRWHFLDHSVGSGIITFVQPFCLGRLQKLAALTCDSLQLTATKWCVRLRNTKMPCSTWLTAILQVRCTEMPQHESSRLYNSDDDDDDDDDCVAEQQSRYPVTYFFLLEIIGLLTLMAHSMTAVLYGAKVTVEHI